MKYSVAILLPLVFFTISSCAPSGSPQEDQTVDNLNRGIAVGLGARTVLTGATVGGTFGGPVGAGVGAAVGAGIAVATHEHTKEAVEIVNQSIYEANQALPGGFGGDGW